MNRLVMFTLMLVMLAGCLAKTPDEPPTDGATTEVDATAAQSDAGTDVKADAGTDVKADAAAPTPAADAGKND